MSWFKLNEPVGTSYRLDTSDLMNTKRALNQLGYYNIPPHRGIDDWTDDAMFDGIRRFQKDNNLKVDAFMRPGGPTETAINEGLSRYAANAQAPEKKPQPSRPPEACTQCPTPQGGTRDNDRPWIGTDDKGTMQRCEKKGIFGPYGGCGWKVLTDPPRR